MNYYNEFDAKAAAWLRELISAGHIPAGDVDERSIEEVKPSDLRGYSQHHFFAGIGGWAQALKLAGWPTDKPVWTGSCPCQPFSAAGRRSGTADGRHLWPNWYNLIKECQPNTVFGEQVASSAGIQWLDIIQNDLEAAEYTAGAIVLPACSVGAPHLRQRLWFVAYTDTERLQGCRQQMELEESGRTVPPRRDCDAVPLADSETKRCAPGRPGQESRRPIKSSRPCEVSVMGNARGARTGWNPSTSHSKNAAEGSESPPSDSFPGAVGGHWADGEWLKCLDGKYRAAKPGAFPLAHGVPARVGRLRGYGNAIVPQVAAEVIKAFMEHEKCK